MGCLCISMGNRKLLKYHLKGKTCMDSILFILKKENGPRASSAPILGLFSITFIYTADLR